MRMRPDILLTVTIFIGLSAGAARAQFGPPPGGPPPEAFTACDGKNDGAACSHPTPHGTMTGTCQQRGQRLQCVPGGPGMGPSGMGGPGGPGGMGNAAGPGDPARQGGGPRLDSDGNEIDFRPSQRYTFTSAPVPIIRSAATAFTLPDGRMHWYEAVRTPEGGVNWVQAKALAEQAGGYLATLHSKEENQFVFNLVADKKFWFEWDGSHNYVMNGPFLGGFQPSGSREPDDGWKWVSGEPWTYRNWAWEGMPGDRDPRPSTQPNDATGNQNVLAFGEVNEPVATWGDFPHKFSSYQSEHDGKAYGFVIEYNRQPK